MIPAWFPLRLFWAYITGIGRIAAGISIVTNVLARLGSFLFAVMVSCFVLFVHVTGVIRDPTSRREWTMLVVSMTITSAAWCVAGSMGVHRAGARGHVTTF